MSGSHSTKLHSNYFSVKTTNSSIFNPTIRDYVICPQSICTQFKCIYKYVSPVMYKQFYGLRLSPTVDCDYIVHKLRFVEAIFCIVELFWSASYSVDRLPCCVYYVTPSQAAGTSGSNRPKGRNQRALCNRVFVLVIVYNQFWNCNPLDSNIFIIALSRRNQRALSDQNLNLWRNVFSESKGVQTRGRLTRGTRSTARGGKNWTIRSKSWEEVKLVANRTEACR